MIIIPPYQAPGGEPYRGTLYPFNELKFQALRLGDLLLIVWVEKAGVRRAV